MADGQIRIPARSGKAARMKSRQVLKVINTHGRQVVDFWAFNARDSREFMSMEHTRPMIKKLTPVPGDELWTNLRRPILKVVRDTTPGVHDTTVAACCPNRYRLLGVKGYHESCQETSFWRLRHCAASRPKCPARSTCFRTPSTTASGAWCSSRPSADRSNTSASRR